MQRHLPATILFLVVAGLFIGVLTNGFVFDDVPQILDNTWIRDFRHLSDIFTHQVWAFANKESNYYRPLMHLAYAIIYVPFGPVPAVFHAANLLLHVFMTLAVFAVIKRIMHPQGSDNAALPVAVFCASLVFAVHPIHVEAVAWISGLPDLACGTFFMLALWAYVVAWDPVRDSRILHIAGAACFLIAALFKEPGITFPGVVATLDLARRRSGRAASYWALRYGALAASTAIYMLLRLNALGGVAPHASESGFDVARALDMAGVATWRYVAMLFWPHPLNAFQTLATATGLPSSIALVGFPVALIVAVWRCSVPWTAALAIFLAPLVPALYAPVLLPGLDNPWAERYTYLPSVGFAVALAIAGAAVPQENPAWRRSAIATALLIVVLLSVMTFERIAIWRDDLTFWTDTVQKSPNAGAAHAALGYALFARGSVDRAITEYEVAIQLKPDHADSYLNLGVALAVKGLHQAALVQYAAAIRLQPGEALAHADLAISLSMLGRHAEAMSEALRAVELRPTIARTHHAMGVALGNAGRISEAAVEFRRAIEMDPMDEQSRSNLDHAEAQLR